MLELDSKFQPQHVHSNNKEKERRKKHTTLFLAHITCTRYHGGEFIGIISCNPFKNSKRCFFLFLRWEFWDSEKLNVRFKITQLGTEWNLNPSWLVLELKYATSILHCLWGTPSPVGYFRAEPRLALRRTGSLDKLADLSYMLTVQLPLKACGRLNPACRNQQGRKDEMWPPKQEKWGMGWVHYKHSDKHIAKSGTQLCVAWINGWMMRWKHLYIYSYEGFPFCWQTASANLDYI